MKFHFSLFIVILFSITFPYDHLDLPECDTTQVIHHTGFSLQYSEIYKNPIWVSEVLTRQKVTATTTDRNGTFKEDHSVVKGTAVPGDYVHSGFDKGHMAPAADMKWSDDAMHECFYMSNMSPQLPRCNRGVWSRLEEQIRKFAEQFDTVYVFTGPVLNNHLQKFNDISIPQYFYKVCLTTTPLQAIGFIVPNDSSKSELSTFCASVDSIEILTHLNFFYVLPDSVENSVENELNIDFRFSHLQQNTTIVNTFENDTSFWKRMFLQQSE